MADSGEAGGSTGICAGQKVASHAEPRRRGLAGYQ